MSVTAFTVAVLYIYNFVKSNEKNNIVVKSINTTKEKISETSNPQPTRRTQ